MSDKIKVLHIIKSLGRGGAEMLLPETLLLHDQTKFEFHYIYFLPWKDQMVEPIRLAGGTVQCLDAANNVQILLRHKDLIRYIQEHAIDLVHCHLPWAGIVGRFIRKSIGKPVLYTEHNMQERYHRITYWINKWTFNKQDLVVAVSEDVLFSIHTNISPRIPVKVIFNGANTEKFRRNEKDRSAIRQSLGIPDDALVVGIVTVFRFQKRLREWLEVFAAVLPGQPNLYGIIVGDGPLRGEVELQVSQLGLADRVLLPGLQTTIAPWYSAMDIFMMSSIYEGMPVAMLEAMSMECAVVSTDAGGIREMIRHERDGLLVPVNQWGRLEDELRKLCRDERLRHQLARAGRRRVETDFSLRRMVNALEELYEANV